MKKLELMNFGTELNYEEMINLNGGSEGGADEKISFLNGVGILLGTMVSGAVGAVVKLANG